MQVFFCLFPELYDETGVYNFRKEIVRMYKKWLLIPGVSVSFVLLLTLGLFLGVFPQGKASGETSSSSEVLESLNAAFIEMAKIARPSVVNITVTMAPRSGSGRGSRPESPWDFWEEFFGRPAPERQQPERRRQPERRQSARGSGFIVREDGYILTNHHVVKNADKIKVILDDKREFNAELVGTDKETEVAVIKIDAKDLPAAALGDSDSLQVGELVMAIGNPFALSHTITNGIVSATGRSGVLDTVTYQDFIQTDAAINPGNSGGPLVNIKGEVIGINTAIALASTASGMPIRGNVGVGFAIPINMARDVMEQLIDTGKVVRGWLGIKFQPVTIDIAEKYGLDKPRGSLIDSVAADGPAEKAGLKSGDLIIEFNDESISDGEHLKKLVAAAGPDEKVKVKVIRQGKEKSFDVKLIERTDEVLTEFGVERGTPGSREEAEGEEEEKWMGITVQELTDELAQRFGHEGQEGVLISSIDPEGPAAELDDPPRSGDLIQEIEFQEIKNMGDYRKAIKSVTDSRSVMIKLLRPRRGPWYIVIKK